MGFILLVSVGCVVDQSSVSTSTEIPEPSVIDNPAHAWLEEIRAEANKDVNTVPVPVTDTIEQPEGVPPVVVEDKSQPVEQPEILLEIQQKSNAKEQPPEQLPDQPQRRRVTSPDAPEPIADVRQVTVSLIILGPAGQPIYPVSVASGSTVEEVMTAAQQQGLTMELRSFGGLGAYVKSINGVAEDMGNQMYWIYRINGEKAVMGISSAVVHGGETIQWVFEKKF